MLKRRSLVLRPADSPRLPADSRRLCHPAFPPPVAHRRKGSGYRVSESLPESIPFNQQVHQVLSDAPPKPPPPFPSRPCFRTVLAVQGPPRKSFQKRKIFPPPRKPRAPWTAPGRSEDFL